LASTFVSTLNHPLRDGKQEEETMFGKRIGQKRGFVGLTGVVTFFGTVVAVIMGMCLFQFGTPEALAEKKKSLSPRGYASPFKACTETARAAVRGCKNDTWDDYWIAIGNCNNSSDFNDRQNCYREANREYTDAFAQCWDKWEARLDICERLGEAPYDPQLDPEQFIDPNTITMENANPYFPLVPGTTWVYEAKDGDGNLLERITVIVTGDIKVIEYPAGSGNEFSCAVVNDVVEEYDEDEDEFSVIEDTLDWYGQDLERNVWYMGEIAKNFEDGELVDLEGSWQAGVDGGKPGILMPANPRPGDFYRQEFLLTEAEDMAEVVSRDDESVRVPYGTFETDVLKTREFTPIEPDVFEFKYYAPGVGTLLEEDPETKERVELIEKSIIVP
jgi:hypothetical protein